MEQSHKTNKTLPSLKRKPSKTELREFSKTTPDNRKETAEKIKQLRESHALSKEKMAKAVSDLQEMVLRKEMEVGETVACVKNLEAQIAEHKRSAFSQLLNYFHIRTLEEKLLSHRSLRDQIEKDYAEMSRRFEELQSIEPDETALEDARKTIDDFYQGQEKAWNDYHEDLKVRDVKNIVRENDCVFVHSIQPYLIPGDNSLLQKWVGFETKLKLLLTFKPTLSASTLKAGDGPEKMWNRMGVILNGGKVLKAGRGDLGSVAEGIQKRRVRDYYSWKGLTPQEEITEAINSPVRTSNYNELVVENLSVLGFYLCLDEFRNTFVDDRVRSDIIHETVEKLGLPMYIIQKGCLYDAEYDDQRKEFVAKTKREPQEILDQSFQLPDETKEKIFQEILADAPFRIKSPEVRLVNSRAFGREAYLQIHAQQIIAQHTSQTTSKKHSPAIPIAEFPRVGEKIQYEVKEGELTLRYTSTHSKVISEGVFNKGRHLDEIILGVWGGYSCTPLTTREDYFVETMKLSEKYHDESIAIAFHLYGFAEQAEALGDLETAAKAEKLASTLLSKEDYQEVIRRRIDSEGRLKITEDDLPR